MSAARRATHLLLGAVGAILPPVTAAAKPEDPDARAERMLARMTPDEKLLLLRGYQPHQMPAATKPTGVPLGAGYVPGVPRLGIPALIESDASLGVANMAGVMRAHDEATALPSTLALAASFDPDLAERAGAMIGSEARAKGFNVLLAGGVNLIREPRGGRNFEYLSEDPLLTGIMGGRMIRGVQSNGVISTVKHYVLNAQETGRTTLSAEIGEAPLRESDLLAFEIAMELGRPGAVMCGYNQVNGTYACESPFLLNDVLRRDWGFTGFVMSDWGAVHGPSIRAGLDQESGTNSRTPPYFGAMLREEIAAGRVGTADVDRSVRRILRTMHANRLFDPGAKAPIDFAADGRLAREVAKRGMVLLKNEGGLLPLSGKTRRILLVGGHADKGVLAGGGSSQVWPAGGAALSLPIPGEPLYHRRLYLPSAPLAALRALLPGASIDYEDGNDPDRAASAARSADIAIVFAEQFAAEGKDVPDLALPDRQDALIAAVAAANPRTAVVLETGGPVAMPWLD